MLGLLPVLLTLALAGSYSGLMPFGSVRPYALQVQDHFLYVAYAFATAGLSALLRWDALFPTLLDVRVLGVLPLSNLRLFAGKVLAGTLFLGILVVGANGPAALFLPALAGAPNVPRHALAHLVAVTVAGCFATSFPLSLLALVEVVCGPALQRFITPLLQSLLVVLMIVLLLASPLLSTYAHPGALPGRVLTLLMPPLWFTGLYEVVHHASPSVDSYAEPSRTGLIATGLSVLTLLVLYPFAYRKRVRRLLEGESSFLVGPPLLSRFPGRLLTWLLPSAHPRAGFCFVAQTLSRVPRLRLGLVISTAIGIGGAVSLTGAETGLHSAVMGLLPGQILIAACFVVLTSVAGTCLMLGTAHEPAAAWLFSIVLGDSRRQFLQGVRRWMLLFSGALGLVALVAAAVWTHPAPILLARELVAICLWCLLVEELFFLPFREAPFTSPRLANQVNAACYLLSLFVVSPVLVALLALVSRACCESWIALAFCAPLVLGFRIAVRRWYPRLDPKLWFLEGDEPMQRLHL